MCSKPAFSSTRREARFCSRQPACSCFVPVDRERMGNGGSQRFAHIALAPIGLAQPVAEFGLGVAAQLIAAYADEGFIGLEAEGEDAFALASLRPPRR